MLNAREISWDRLLKTIPESKHNADIEIMNSELQVELQGDRLQVELQDVEGNEGNNQKSSTVNRDGKDVRLLDRNIRKKADSFVAVKYVCL